MGSFSMGTESEVKVAVDSFTIARLRSITDNGKVDAHSLKHRHPRFKDRFTKPHFYAWFKIRGSQYGEDADSLDALNVVLERDYLSAEFRSATNVAGRNSIKNSNTTSPEGEVLFVRNFAAGAGFRIAKKT